MKTWIRIGALLIAAVIAGVLIKNQRTSPLKDLVIALVLLTGGTTVVSLGDKNNATHIDKFGLGLLVGGTIYIFAAIIEFFQ